MEKVVYSVTADDRTTAGALSERLRGEVTAQLVDLGAHGAQVNVADDAVAPAAGLRIASSSTPAKAIVSVWIDSAIDRFRRPFDDAVTGASSTMAAYLVSESVPVPNERFPAGVGRRTEG